MTTQEQDAGETTPEQEAAAQSFFGLMIKASSVTGSRLMLATSISFIAATLAEMDLPDDLLEGAIEALGRDLKIGVAEYRNHKSAMVN